MKITVEYICKAHYEIIKMTGGSQGLRDTKLLESLVNGVYQTFDSKELYPTIVDKAAFLCFSLIQNHAFVDGNKRIGINIMQVFLHMNGYKISANDDELIDLGLGVATSKYNKDAIKEWIIRHKC